MVALPNEHKVLFYGSADLKQWERLSEFGPAGAAGGQWECPTLTEVPLEGSGPRQTRWVLKVGLNPGGLQGGSGEQYFVGSFDGSRFVNDNSAGHDPLDGLRQGLLLRAHLQQSAAHPMLRHARLDE